MYLKKFLNTWEIFLRKKIIKYTGNVCTEDICTTIDRESDEREMSESNVFKVLSDAQRRQILEMLKDGRLSAGEIAEKLDVSPAALSYHLRLLKEAELVNEYRSGNFIYYELNTTVLQDIILWVKGLGGE